MEQELVPATTEPSLGSLQTIYKVAPIISSRGGDDDGVGLGVHRTAQLVPLAAGDIVPLPQAPAQVGAILPTPGRTIVAGGNNRIVFDDDGTVIFPQAGAPLADRAGDIKIIILFVSSDHADRLLCFFHYTIADGGKSRKARNRCKKVTKNP